MIENPMGFTDNVTVKIVKATPTKETDDTNDDTKRDHEEEEEIEG